jgi:hypothetical protein
MCARNVVRFENTGQERTFPNSAEEYRRYLIRVMRRRAPLFAVHTGAWPVARLGISLLESSCFALFGRRRPLHRGRIRARQIPNLPEFLKIFLEQPD